MTFRKLKTEREWWQSFCAHDSELIDQLSRISLAFQSPTRFEDLLASGSTASKDLQVTFRDLDDTEWKAFVAFVEQYSREWQTWFVETLFPAYFQEAKRRDFSHLDYNSE